MLTGPATIAQLPAMPPCCLTAVPGPTIGAHVSSEALLQPPPQRLLPSRAAADPAAEDASERLAAMMLEGWTLMGIHCPRWVMYTISATPAL